MDFSKDIIKSLGLQDVVIEKIDQILETLSLKGTSSF